MALGLRLYHLQHLGDFAALLYRRYGLLQFLAEVSEFKGRSAELGTLTTASLVRQPDPANFLVPEVCSSMILQGELWVGGIEPR